MIYHINLPLSFGTFYLFSNNSNSFILLPFIFMIFFSILLIVTIFKSKARLTDSLSENRYFRKDVKLSFSLLAMNLLFIILDLPDEIDLFLPFISRWHSFVIFHLLSVSILFYLLILNFVENFIHYFVKKKFKLIIWEENSLN